MTVVNRRRTHIKGSIRMCIFPDGCDKVEIHDGLKWRISWSRYQDGYLCGKHYRKLIGYPRVTVEQRKKYNSKITYERRKYYYLKRKQNRLQFKDKRIHLLDVEPRKKPCLLCGKKVGDEYVDHYGKIAKVKRMNVHHIEYHDDDPMKDTIVLCNSCHSIESWRIRRKNNNS